MFVKPYGDTLNDGAVQLFDLGSPGAVPKLLGSSEGEVRSLAWVGGDKGLGVGSLDGAVEVWGVSPSEPIRKILPAHASGVTAIATGDGTTGAALVRAGVEPLTFDAFLAEWCEA